MNKLKRKRTQSFYKMQDKKVLLTFAFLSHSLHNSGGEFKKVTVDNVTLYKNKHGDLVIKYH